MLPAQVGRILMKVRFDLHKHFIIMKYLLRIETQN